MNGSSTEQVWLCYKHISFIFKHYFIIIPGYDLEIHPGHYKNGTHQTLGYTKDYSIEKKVDMCRLCLNCLLKTALDLRDTWYYPYINCETLSKALIGETPISKQLLTCSVGLFTITLLAYKPIYIAFVLSVILFIYVIICLENEFTQKSITFQRCTCFHSSLAR